jgi:hypothetical protein
LVVSTGKRKKKRRRSEKPAVEPPVLVDPEFAVMVRVPIRTSIVAAGHQRLISPVEIAEAYDYNLQYISDQFKALVKADLLELVETVKVRGVLRHMYRSTRRAFVTTPDWSQFGRSIQEGMSGAIIQDLNGQVARSMEAGTLDARDDRYLFWECMLADEISWANSTRIIDLAVKALKEQSVEAVNRHANGESDGVFPATFALLSFESPTESALKRKRKRKRPKPARKPAKGKAAKRKTRK